MFKLINCSEQQLLCNITDEISFEHPYNTRNSNEFRLPQTLIEFNKRFFIVNAIKFWRSLSDDTKNSATISEFKYKIKKKFLKWENDSSQTESISPLRNAEYTNDSSLQVATLSNLSQEFDPQSSASERNFTP